MSNLSQTYEKNRALESNFSKVITNDNLWAQLKKRIITTEGGNIKSPSVMNQFGLVLENERKYLLTESANTQFDVAKVSKIILPLVRRYWPMLIANEIVSTQQISAPTGFIRKLVVNYQNTQLPGIVPLSGQNLPQSQELVSAANAITHTNTTQSWVKTGLVPNISIGSVKLFFENTVPSGTQLSPIYFQSDDGLGKIVGTFDSHPVVGSVDYVNGVVVVYFVGQQPTKPQSTGTWTLKVDYQKDWVSQTNDDFTGREVTFDVTNEAVTVQNRKLRAKWYPEFWEDVQAIDGLDAQVEMYDTIANIIAQEINGQILNELFTRQDPDNLVTWDKQQPTSGFFGNRKEWYETFMIKINELAQKMQSKTNIAEPNILVMHPTSLSVLRSQLQYYGASDIKPLSDDTISMGYKKFDVNGGTYKVFTSNLAPSDEVLMIYKGQKIEESGYIYAPYIPLTAVPWTENTGQMGIVFHSRYATHMYRTDWFGKISILNPTAG